MTNKKPEYTFDKEAFDKAYFIKHGKEIDIYETAKELNVTYQTINNMITKPIKTISNFKILSKLSGEPINKLIKKTK